MVPLDNRSNSPELPSRWKSSSGKWHINNYRVVEQHWMTHILAFSERLHQSLMPVDLDVPSCISMSWTDRFFCADKLNWKWLFTPPDHIHHLVSFSIVLHFVRHLPEDLPLQNRMSLFLIALSISAFIHGGYCYMCSRSTWLQLLILLDLLYYNIVIKTYLQHIYNNIIQ